MNKLASEIGARLRTARVAAGFRSAKSFIQKYGIAQSTYSQYENGKRLLDAENVVKLCDFLGISATWLLTGKETSNAGRYLDKNTLLAGKTLNDLAPQTLNKSGLSVIDTEVFTLVLKEIIAVINSQHIHVDHEGIVDFCYDIYNNIINTSTNNADKIAMIRLAIASLKRGGLLKKNQISKSKKCKAA